MSLNLYPPESSGGGLWIQTTGVMRNIDYSMLSDVQKALLTDLNLSGLALTEPPILTGCTAITQLNLSSNSLTTLPVLTGFVLLEGLNLNSNQFTAPPDLTGFTALTVISINANPLSGAPDLSDQTLLVTLELINATLTVAPDLTGLTVLVNVDLNNNALPTAEVNAILVQLDANGASGGTVDLSGGTNGAPDGAGAAAKTSLEGNGWTVTVN